jgi:hypothetical protein
LAVTLKEEHRLRVFENRVLRRIFGPGREEVAGGWRKLHNEELHNLYSSLNITRVIEPMRRLTGHAARMVEVKKFIRYFGWKTRSEETSRKTQA